MNALNEMSPLLTNSLQTSLAVAVLFALMLIVRKPFARHFGAKAAYALWLVPLARLFMPPLSSGYSVFGLLAPAEKAAGPAATASEVVFVRSAGAETANLPLTPPAPPAVIELQSALAPVSNEPGLLDAVLASLPALIVPVWVMGTLTMLAVSWRRQAVFHQLIRDDSAPASDAVSDIAREIAAQLKVRREVDVRTSLLNGSPLVTGLLRPVILLPEWFEADYTPREQRDALTHELMHVKRGDLFTLQLAQIVLALQWFNPLAYFSIRAFRVDQEAACDADVLRAGTSSAFSYGRTLVKAARLAGPADSAFRGANLTLAHPIKERLILMQNSAPTFRRRLLGTTLAVTLGTSAMFATASCAASASPKGDPSAELAGGNDDQAQSFNDRHADGESHRQARTYRFSSHGGEDDHQFVLLSDPFKDLEPRMRQIEQLDLSDLEEEMRVLSIEMTNLAELEQLESLEGLHDLDFSGMAALAELGNIKFVVDVAFDGTDFQTIETEDGIKIIIPEQSIFLSKNMDQFEAQIEAMAERAEAMAEVQAGRAEEWAEAHAGRAEAWAARFESRMEEKSDRMEELAERMETRIELAFSDGLEDKLEDAGEIIEQLADDCEDRSEDSASPALITARGEDNKTYRALCVKGDRSRLQDKDVNVFVMNHPALSSAEKERFENNRSYEFEYSRTDD